MTEEEKKQHEIHAQKVEKFVTDYFNEHEDRIRWLYTKHTGKILPMYLESYEKKDLFDRFILWRLFDKHFRQVGIKERTDGFASGAPVELKYNTYGVDENTCFIIDESKVRDMTDESRIVVLYFDFENEAIYARQFLVKDIKKYGRLSNKGGKVDNVDKEDSGKPMYYISHQYAEDVHVWRKNEKKS